MSGLADRLIAAEKACVQAGVKLDTHCVLTNLAEALTMEGQFSVTVAELLGLAGVVERGE